MAMALSLAVGAGIGTLLGLLGGGGSILAVPALIYVVHLDLAQAIPLALIVVAAAAAVGAVPRLRRGQVQWRLAAVFVAGGVPATVIGAAVGKHLTQTTVLVGLAALMVLAGVRMLRGEEGAGSSCVVSDHGIDWRRCLPRAIPTGMVVGLLTGLFGVGGGFLIIPALVLMLGVEMPVAVGTSLIVILANSMAGLLAHLGHVDVDWSITAAFVAAAMIASLCAAHLGSRLDTTRLRRWFGYLIVTVAGYVLFDSLVLR